MIEITLPELERRIHRFEAGLERLELLSQSGVQRGGEFDAIQSNVKAFRIELEDMRRLHAQLVADGAQA